MGRARAGVASANPRFFLASSDLHLQCKLRITRNRRLEQTYKSIAYARSFCDDVEFSPEDATRSDVDFLCSMVQNRGGCRRDYSQHS